MEISHGIVPNDFTNLVSCGKACPENQLVSGRLLHEIALQVVALFDHLHDERDKYEQYDDSRCGLSLHVLSPFFDQCSWIKGSMV